MEQRIQEFINRKKHCFIETYGCQMNSHESEKLLGILEQLGFAECSDKQQADLILFNTCCVRDGAEQRVFGNIGRLRKLKKDRPQMKIGVCGCMMQQKGAAENLMRRFDFVDIAFGTYNVHRLADMVIRAFVSEEKVIEVEKQPGKIVEDVPMHRNQGPLCYVNIMYGCNNYCSYCIVPYVRGPERSRKSQDIIEEIQSLREQGYREVMLLGQNVNSYGKGLSGEPNFAELLEKVAEQTGMDRIRFMTSHPKDISEELIRIMAKHKNICNHLHLPVQSGSDRILTLMNRHYTKEHYLRYIQMLREEIPHVGLSTDIIVGFPGETEQDFEETLALVEQVQYDQAYMFMYSVRTGTKAAAMDGHLPEEVKSQRLSRLIDLQNEITFKTNQEYVGRVEQVLVEHASKRDNNELCGRTQSNKMVNFASKGGAIGQLVPVKITQAKKTTLYGEQVD